MHRTKIPARRSRTRAIRGTDYVDMLLCDMLLSLDAHPADPAILIVAIDDESLTKVGGWPWPRNVQAQLLQAIADGGPRAVGYDVQMLESSADDAAVAQAIAGAIPVFLPLAMIVPGRDGNPFDLVEPPTAIRTAAAGLGHANLVSDGGGVIRRVRLWDGAAGTPPVPHLMIRMSEALAPRPPLAAAPASFAARRFPFAGPPGTFPTISAAAILQGDLPPELLHDRIVLVGATAQGLGVWHPVSVRGSNGTMSGVEIQANILSAILNDEMIAEGTAPTRAAMALVPLWLLFAGFRFGSPRAILGLICCLSAGLLAISLVILSRHDLWLSPGLGMLMLMLAYPLWSWRRLTMISGFMSDELAHFQHAPGAPPNIPRTLMPIDPLGRQSMVLHNAITTLRTTQRQREDFVQFLSHDMRSPQVSIISSLAIAQPGEICAELAGRIGSYARRTLALADNLVHLARAHAIAYETDTVDLHDVLLDALDELWPQILARNVTVAVTAAEDSLLVPGSRELLTRSVINVVDNAIKYGPAGGTVECSLQHGPPGQGAGAGAGAGFVTLTVTDQGPGFSRDRESRHFRKFERAQPSSASTAEDGVGIGVGLGLVFVQTVIERHFGEVAWENAPHGGAIFTIRLPREAPRRDQGA